VRGWTWLYTWHMSSLCRETRRAEIESDLWEFQCDAAEDHRLRSALHILVRLLIGIPDDLGWRVEQGAVAGTLTQRSIALSARVVGAALFICTIWVIDADASRRRPAMAVAGGAVVFGQEIEGVMTTRAGNGPHAATSRLPRLTAGIVATVGMSMLPQPAAQSPPSVTIGPTFEVASIKPNPTGSSGPTSTHVLPGGRYVATNMPIRLLIGQTYRVSSLRLVGGPSWIASEHFDINAKANGELFPRGGERPLDSALRALLADRFKLIVHTETRPLPIYALRMTHSDGRLGPNLTRSSTTDCDAVLAAGQGRGGAPPPPPLRPGQAPPCGARDFPGTLWADSLPLSFLAGVISGEVNRTVVDRTGLTGRFSFHLTWTPDPVPPRPPGDQDDLPPIDPNGPSIFTAVQEQLGLKLESTTSPVDVLVIDRVEHPTPN
jgi:uncharacterized protein (TIGR03435 family)